MSLFERIKNKRLSLQEKKEDKTDRSVKQSEVSKQAKKFTKKINQKNINRPEGVIGDTYVSTDKKGKIRSAKKVNPTLQKSVSQVKADIEFKQGLQKVRKFAGQKGTGELADKTPQKVVKFVKDKRAQKIKDLKLPDTSFDAKTKFSQKGFEKSLKKSTKGPSTGIVDPFKGSEITKGQANVKGLESKAFKKTKPSDIKLPNTFKNFSLKLRRLKSDIQDFKDRDLPGGPRKGSKVNVSGADNLTRQDVGMAPPDTRSKAQKYTDKINTAKASKNTMPSGKNFINKYRKQAETATTNLRKQVDTIAKNPTLTGSEKAKQSREVMKKVKTAQNFARGYKNNPSSAVIRTSDLKTVTSAAKGQIVKPSIRYTGVTAKGNPSRAINPFAKITSQATIKDIAKQKGPLKQLKNYKYYAGAKKIAAKSPFAKKAIIGTGKILGKLGTKGRVAAAGIGLLASNPGVRNFVKNTAIAGGLAGALGLAKPKQNVLKVGKGVTKTTNLPSKFQPKNAKNLSYVDAYGKKRKLESGDVRFNFGLTGSKKNKDGTVTPGGMQYNKQDMARVKNIQKKYIDSYNASVKNNPFKKQIKYSVNKDGSYTVTPPKKK